MRGSGGFRSGGGHGGCERRIEVIVKMQKSRGSGSYLEGWGWSGLG